MHETHIDHPILFIRNKNTPVLNAEAMFRRHQSRVYHIWF